MKGTYKQLVIRIEVLHKMRIDLGGQSIVFNQPIGSTHIDMIIPLYHICDAAIVLPGTIQVVHNCIKHKNSSFGPVSAFIINHAICVSLSLYLSKNENFFRLLWWPT